MLQCYSTVNYVESVWSRTCQHQALCDKYCIEASHGLGHALRVLEHVDKAKYLATVQNFKGLHARTIRLKQRFHADFVLISVDNSTKTNCMLKEPLPHFGNDAGSRSSLNCKQPEQMPGTMRSNLYFH